MYADFRSSVPRQSSECKSRRTGKPLRTYLSESEAQSHANHIRRAHGTDLVPYKCERCGGWHLCPRERQTPSVPCEYCVGRDGRPKALYDSREAALRRAGILERERGVSLHAYECPEREGWHLTSRTAW